MKTRGLGAAARLIDAQIDGIIGRLIANGDFAGKLGDTLLLPHPAGAAAERVLLTGLGPQASFGRKQYRKAVQSGAQAVLKTGASDATVYLALHDVPGMDGHFRARAVAEIFSAASVSGSRPEERRQAEAGQACRGERGRRKRARAQVDRLGPEGRLGHRRRHALTRDLGNLPPNICTPTYFGSARSSSARNWAASSQRLREREIKALKMGAFLAVTQGSARAAAADRLRVPRRQRGAAPICLIGKGITFDSGGISLKDPPAMDEMKFDMSGAATRARHARAPWRS